MGAGMHWVIPVIAVILMGGAATAYLLRVRLPRDETAAGVAALAGMSWRDFINVVLGALTLRGYTRVFDDEATRDDSEYILERDGKRWLLSCKHGSAFVLGPATLTEMANAIRLHGLAGGLLLTQGRIAKETSPFAALQHIELLDGATLWPELRDLIPAEQRRDIEADARQRVRKQVVLIWLLALFVAIALFFMLRADDQTGEVGHTPPAAEIAVATPPEPTATPAPKPLADPHAAAVATETIDSTSLEHQRQDVAKAISTLPSVDRAIWATQSTLQVYLLRVEGDAKVDICPLIERHPVLASSRVQLTPPQGSSLPVRFLQCRTY